MKNCRTLRHTKERGKGAGKAGIPRDLVVYTGLGGRKRGEEGKELVRRWRWWWVGEKGRVGGAGQGEEGGEGMSQRWVATQWDRHTDASTPGLEAAALRLGVEASLSKAALEVT